MQAFTYEPHQVRVIFGGDCTEQLPEEVSRLGASRTLVLYSSHFAGIAKTVGERLGDRLAGLYEGTVQHVPVEVAEAATTRASEMGADCCIAIGGGSTIGLAKAITLRTAIPIIAAPTTYAGSEMTPIWGITERGEKRTGRDNMVLPRVVVYDPHLTLALPPSVSGSSGINALAHCVEALYAPDGSPIVTLMAAEGIHVLTVNLPRIIAAPNDLDARSDVLYGAMLAGASLGAVGMGLHHKLCHVLGGSFHLPHAETHAVILPHVMHYNKGAAPQAMQRVADAMGVPDPVRGVFALVASLGVPTALKDVGMQAGDLDTAAELAMRTPYVNPAPLTRESLRRLLEDAYYGRLPNASEDTHRSRQGPHA